MKEIQTKKGIVLVDDDDFVNLSKFKWYVTSKGYCARRVTIGDKLKQVFMHRFITNAPDNLNVDHKDRNKLNNQKNNLRLCEQMQNTWNSEKRNNLVTSKFKGVSIENCRGYKYYKCKITVNGKIIRKFFPLTTEGEIQAAKKYNELAKEHFKDFALVNNIIECQPRS
jgi:hypothetical protein